LQLNYWKGLSVYAYAITQESNISGGSKFLHLYTVRPYTCLNSPEMSILDHIWPTKGGETGMPFVKVSGSGSFENALRKFKKQCEREGILSEIKKREHYDKPKKALKSMKKYSSR
jgi:small subunit ribosomal protein S21